jgi:hypothetical protein
MSVGNLYTIAASPNTSPVHVTSLSVLPETDVQIAAGPLVPGLLPKLSQLPAFLLPLFVIQASGQLLIMREEILELMYAPLDQPLYFLVGVLLLAVLASLLFLLPVFIE